MRERKIAIHRLPPETFKIPKPKWNRLSPKKLADIMTNHDKEGQDAN